MFRTIQVGAVGRNRDDSGMVLAELLRECNSQRRGKASMRQPEDHGQIVLRTSAQRGIGYVVKY
ncbi:hypothetical protein Q1B87_003753 [Salmonella enterica]